MAGALRAGLDRSGPGPGGRGAGRPGATLFVVSSKSGTTLEPNIFKQYFFERVQQTSVPARRAAGSSRSPIPGSKLEQAARADGFRHVLFGLPSIGGRYSALSDFGMVPGGPHGTRRRAVARRRAGDGPRLRAAGPPRTIPAPCSGRSWACSASRGRDKVTLVASPGIHDLGRLARAAPGRVHRQGGQGPDPGRPRAPRAAGASTADDRLFVYLRLDSAPDAAQDRGVAASRRPGSPWSGSTSPSLYQIAAEFFRWEFATAVAGAILGIDPFDQPDVEASKVATRRLTDEFETDGTPARRDADPRDRGGPALRRSAERAASWRRAAARSPASCAPTWRGSGPATTPRSSPTSR